MIQCIVLVCRLSEKLFNTGGEVGKIWGDGISFLQWWFGFFTHHEREGFFHISQASVFNKCDKNN